MSRRDNPNYDFMAVNYAALMVQTHRPAAALAILNREILEAPTYSRAWSNRAAIFFVDGQREAARSDAENALRLDPQNPQARSVLQMLSR
jgi:Flp pilus assembly protein TadD